MNLKQKQIYLAFPIMLLVLVAITTVAQMSLAQSPVEVSGPPRPPADILMPEPTFKAEETALNTVPLKAVLLVGPIDGNEGDWTRREIANMENAATVLESHGVEVYRFYPGTGTFEEIEAAVNGAHFLLYRGHGVYDGKIPNPTVGGFSLSSGFYLPERIRQNMRPAENAIVMIYGCFAAGSSSASGDTYDIGIAEASRRVAQYSDPFFDIGAGGYYSNWFGSAFSQFLNNLFAGQTLGQAYENYFDFNDDTVYRTVHSEYPAMSMWLDKDYWNGYWEYNNAFAGKADQTLEDLFSRPELGGLPKSGNLVYSLPEQAFLQEVYAITPQNIGNGVTLSWQVDKSASWFSVEPKTGQTPNGFTIIVSDTITNMVAVYTGMITVTVISPEDVYNSKQAIPVTLQVVDRPFVSVYLPLISRSSR